MASTTWPPFLLILRHNDLAKPHAAMAPQGSSSADLPSPEPPSGPRNVLGEPLVACGCQPLTGWFRDGTCRSDPSDLGRHTVCCEVNEAFLSYSRAQGNDLSTPMPAYAFPGLQPGDRWCVCATRWLQAYEDGMAPPVVLAACEASSLEIIPLDILRSHAL